MTNTDRFDTVLLSRARLGIISVLIARKAATFMELKAILSMTQGNLTIQLRKLEEVGYVAMKKEFVKRKPRTTCRLTTKGRKAFLTHLDVLRAIADGADTFES